jgi:hypothetical protein
MNPGRQSAPLADLHAWMFVLGKTITLKRFAPVASTVMIPVL